MISQEIKSNKVVISVKMFKCQITCGKVKIMKTLSFYRIIQKLFHVNFIFETLDLLWPIDFGFLLSPQVLFYLVIEKYKKLMKFPLL